MNEFKLSCERFFAATRQHFFVCEAACVCHLAVDGDFHSADCGATRQYAPAGN
ncbi:MAG: hypothetical protein AW10_00607 [Candidatus Accumulibacter appositus]|uniref:Uncharacterized protein n=1 Tax=Candidatus Accumulibacter appositus TaxID=1454003 RepID=A0A011QUI2_9PROT|nr:MAG: hypothetical protein AW10_00607 [Candidatus Accumulibacter appositus]